MDQPSYTLADEELCKRYNVRIYRAEDLPGPQEAVDAGKYIVTTDAGDFADHHDRIPSASTLSEAQALAVQVLKLRELLEMDRACSMQIRQLRASK
ncbi:hypothetical protein [Janthinobacterium sp. MDT1-19]|uniref:hypothetical protein n=1 Tax=Janthinobacterium sp. MDT1-19 TaxID=1259339 RepID=UPI003F293D08